jgi:hypothetical protein
MKNILILTFMFTATLSLSVLSSVAHAERTALTGDDKNGSSADGATVIQKDSVRLEGEKEATCGPCSALRAYGGSLTQNTNPAATSQKAGASTSDEDGNK